MPSNKNAFLRYRLIDDVLQTRRKLSLVELCSKVSDKLIEAGVLKNGTSISERQLLYDIAEMKKDRPLGFSAPIVRKGGMIYYDQISYRMFGADISDHEIEQIANMFSIYDNYWNIPQSRAVKLFIEKYGSQKNTNHSIKDMVEFNVNQDAAGVKRLGEMITIVSKEKRVIINYQSFVGESIQYIVDPLLLKEYNNRWFLITYDHENTRYTNLGLDRIKDIRLMPDPIETKKRSEIKSRLKHCVGVSLPNVWEGPETVTLRISEFYKNYLFTKPLHFSQRIIEEDDRIQVSFKLVVNNELIAEILRWGKEIEVTGPDLLREKVLKQHQLAVINYQKI